MVALSKASRPRTSRTTRRARSARNNSGRDRTISSEEAIKAGEQIALAAFASGLKLAAAFGTVAAKTAGLALASLASGADKFSELVKEEALRSTAAAFDGGPESLSVASRPRTTASRKKRAR